VKLLTKGDKFGERNLLNIVRQTNLFITYQALTDIEAICCDKKTFIRFFQDFEEALLQDRVDFWKQWFPFQS